MIASDVHIPPPDGGWYWVDDKVVAMLPTIGHAGLTLYNVLATFADRRTRQCWPSIKTLMQRSTLSRRTVLRATGVLETAGLIRVERTTDEKGVPLPNRYALLPVGDGVTRAPTPPTRDGVTRAPRTRTKRTRVYLY